MPKELPWKAFLCALGFVVVTQVSSTNPVSLVFAAEKLSNQLSAVSFENHGVVNKVRLGAAYLLRPEVAERADVVWGYKLGDTAVQKIISEESPNTSLYFKAPDSDDYIVLSLTASKLAIENSGSFEALLESMKGKDIELGVVLDQPKWHGLEHARELINWKDGSEKSVSFTDEATTQAAINELLQTGMLKE